MGARVDAIGASNRCLPLEAVEPGCNRVTRGRVWIVVGHRHAEHARPALRIAQTRFASSGAADCDGHAPVRRGVAGLVGGAVSVVEALHAGARTALRCGAEVRAIARHRACFAPIRNEVAPRRSHVRARGAVARARGNSTDIAVGLRRGAGAAIRGGTHGTCLRHRVAGGRGAGTVRCTHAPDALIDSGRPGRCVAHRRRCAARAVNTLHAAVVVGACRHAAGAA